MKACARSRVMIDHGIMTCVSRDAPAHRAGRIFFPLRFWMSYGIWTEADGAKVLFSRDYCPLWKIQEGIPAVIVGPGSIKQAHKINPLSPR